MKNNKNASIKNVELAENVIKVTFGKAGAIGQYMDIDCCACGARFSGKLDTETLVTNTDGTRTVNYIGRVSKFAKVFHFGKSATTTFVICGNCGRYKGFDGINSYKDLEKAVYKLDSERKNRTAARDKRETIGGKIK